jgi:AcrR family transcriptional regulator
MEPRPDEQPFLEPRQRLLEAAEDLFAQRGFDGATVREICDRAGMNVAAVNYHFGDKQALFVEAVKSAYACATAGLPPTWPPGTPPVEKLRTFIRMMATAMNGPVRPSALQLMMREMANPSPAVVALVEQYTRPMAHGLVGIVGELFPNLPPRRRMMIGFSVVGQCLFYRQNRQIAGILFGKEAVAALDPDEVAEHIAKLTLAGLGHGEPYRDPGGAP